MGKDNKRSYGQQKCPYTKRVEQCYLCNLDYCKNHYGMAKNE